MYTTQTTLNIYFSLPTITHTPSFQQISNLCDLTSWLILVSLSKIPNDGNVSFPKAKKIFFFFESYRKLANECVVHAWDLEKLM